MQGYTEQIRWALTEMDNAEPGSPLYCEALRKARRILSILDEAEYHRLIETIRTSAATMRAARAQRAG